MGTTSTSRRLISDRPQVGAERCVREERRGEGQAISSSGHNRRPTIQQRPAGLLRTLSSGCWLLVVCGWRSACPEDRRDRPPHYPPILHTPAGGCPTDAKQCVGAGGQYG